MLRIIFQIISWAALAGIIVPPCLFAADVLDLDAVKRHMLVATIVWFVFTPLWMGRKNGEQEATS